MDIIFRLLREFELTANPNSFKVIFGDISNHLWDKFSNKSRGNLIAFSRTLDEENYQKLIAYLEAPVASILVK